MAARGESARRVSGCVTALLQDQPFFGSLALRLPIRPDPARETLASDGREIRYSPDWVANTDADLIKTAIGRVVLACALKHHTRRGMRDPRTLAARLPARHPRVAARRRLQAPARRASLGRHQRRAGLRPACPSRRKAAAKAATLPLRQQPPVTPALHRPARATTMTGAMAMTAPATMTGKTPPILPIATSPNPGTVRAKTARAMQRPAGIPRAPARSWTRRDAATTRRAPATCRPTSRARSRPGTRPCTRR